MEGELGADLSGVAIHTGSGSAKAADDLGARAMTIGADIHFAAGEFRPETKDGDQLLAHELAHVVQGQRSGVQRKADEADGEEAGPDVSQPDEPAEKEADHVADRVASNLHLKGEHADPKREAEEEGPTEEAPTLAAKLDPGKVHLAGRDPLGGSQRDELGTGPEVSAVHVGNAVQAGVQAPPQHHVFPQEHRAWFAERGVDVDQFCVTLEQSHHQAIHAKPPKEATGKAADDAKKWEWNAAIMGALRREEQLRGRKLLPDEIIATGRRLMPDYGLTGNFEQYRGA
jgi:hypothetical protein